MKVKLFLKKRISIQIESSDNQKLKKLINNLKISHEDLKYIKELLNILNTNEKIAYSLKDIISSTSSNETHSIALNKELKNVKELPISRIIIQKIMHLTRQELLQHNGLTFTKFPREVTQEINDFSRLAQPRDQIEAQYTGNSDNITAQMTIDSQSYLLDRNTICKIIIDSLKDKTLTTPTCLTKINRPTLKTTFITADNKTTIQSFPIDYCTTGDQLHTNKEGDVDLIQQYDWKKSQKIKDLAKKQKKTRQSMASLGTFDPYYSPLADGLLKGPCGTIPATDKTKLTLVDQQGEETFFKGTARVVDIPQQNNLGLQLDTTGNPIFIFGEYANDNLHGQEYDQEQSDIQISETEISKRFYDELKKHPKLLTILIKSFQSENIPPSVSPDHHAQATPIPNS